MVELLGALVSLAAVAALVLGALVGTAIVTLLVLGAMAASTGRETYGRVEPAPEGTGADGRERNPRADTAGDSGGRGTGREHATGPGADGHGVTTRADAQRTTGSREPLVRAGAASAGGV